MKPFFHFLLAAFSLAIAATASAQAPVTPAPTATEDEDLVTIELPGNPATEVLDLYESLTGKTLVRDANLAGPLISIVVPNKIPRKEAIALIESVLLLNNYSIVPVNDKTAKVLGTGTPPLGQGIPLYADPGSLPSGEQIISYFMLLRYISTKDAMEVLTRYAPPAPRGTILAVPNSNAIVITDNTPLVRRMIALQQLIDVPGSRTLTELVPLQRADAEKVAEIVNKLLEEEKSHTEGNRASVETPVAQQPGQPPGSPPTPATPQGGTQTLAPIQGESHVIADLRTNRILIVAPESRMPYLRQLVQDLDAAVALEAPLERSLKFASAIEVLPVLASTLAEGDDKVETQAQAGGAGGNTPNSPNSSGAGTLTGGGGGGAGDKPDILGTPDQNTAPISASVGKTRLIADPASNKIIVIGAPESKNKASDILNMLDQRPKQVYLATIIGQLTLSNDLEVGFDYLLKFKNFNPGGPTTGLGGLLRTRTAGTDLLPDPSSLLTNAAIPALSGLTIYGTIAETVDIYAKALQTSNRFKILSRPVVYTANNKKAVISSGQEVPIPVSTSSTALNTTVNDNTGATFTSNIEYKPVVLKLEVIPLVNSDNEVTLTIAQQNDSILERVVVSNNEVPVIGSQKLTTTITVKNRTTVVLGGLITEEDQNNKSGIPLLSNIPGLGYFFSTTKKTKIRRELIVLIQPLIVNSEADLADAQMIERSMSNMKDDLYDDKLPVRKALPVHPEADLQLPPAEVPAR